MGFRREQREAELVEALRKMFVCLLVSGVPRHESFFINQLQSALKRVDTGNGSGVVERTVLGAALVAPVLE